MSDQLREALRELAVDAPDIDATAAASSLTWRKARQARRRGLAAVALAVVALLVGGTFVAVGLSSITKPAPAGPVPYDESKLAIPDQVWIPSPWTPSTDEAGPLGPLALIAFAQRRTSWFHTDERALLGVSAVDGTYRFIDLPRIDRDPWGTDEVALSPDGTKIGYWLSDGSGSDAGLAVYDSVTGDVTTHEVSSRFGLAGQWMGWSADSQRLAANYGVFRAANRDVAHYSPSIIWQPGTGQILRTDYGQTLGAPPSSWTDGLAFVAGGRTVVLLNPLDGSTSKAHLSVAVATPGAESPDGQRIAVVGSPDRCCMGNGTGGTSSGGAVYVAHRPSAPAGVWRAAAVTPAAHVVGGTVAVVGWRDDTHVVIVRVFADAPLRMSAVDVETGDVSKVLSAPSDADPAPNVDQTFWPTVATDLLAHPFVEATPPASIRDPRLIPGVVLAFVIVVSALGAMRWLYRRRLRARVWEPVQR